jgi:hypothetical protein
MEVRAGLASRVGFLAASSMVLFGCPNPNTYTTPRTIGSGHFQGSIAAEAWGYIPTGSANDAPQTHSETYPTAPTVTVRLGLGDRWEIGARVANVSSLGGDLKYNFLKSSRIDLALDPAFQIFELEENNTDGSSQTATFFHVPLLVGVNVSPTVSLVFTPGASWGFTSGGMISFRNATGQVGSTTGAIWRFGVGADFRMTPRFAFHPEITFLRGLGTNIIYMAGLGFNFGAMPSYDDVGGGPPPAPPPPGD